MKIAFLAAGFALFIAALALIALDAAVPDTGMGRFATARLNMSLLPMITGRTAAFASIGWKVGVAVLIGGFFLIRKYRRRS
ncbi:MAG: hypothetical protein AAB533_02975 [Patescibacteria group bacterium]